MLKNAPRLAFYRERKESWVKGQRPELTFGLWSDPDQPIWTAKFKWVDFPECDERCRLVVDETSWGGFAASGVWTALLGLLSDGCAATVESVQEALCHLGFTKESV